MKVNFAVDPTLNKAQKYKEVIRTVLLEHFNPIEVEEIIRDVAESADRYFREREITVATDLTKEQAMTLAAAGGEFFSGFAEELIGVLIELAVVKFRLKKQVCCFHDCKPPATA